MNRFIKYKNIIKEIAETEGVDVGVATNIFITRNGEKDYTEELKEFNKIIATYQKDPKKTLADFFAE